MKRVWEYQKLISTIHEICDILNAGMISKFVMSC